MNGRSTERVSNVGDFKGAPKLVLPGSANTKRVSCTFFLGIPARKSTSTVSSKPCGRVNALQKHLGSLAGKLEPGLRLKDSTLILNHTRRAQDSVIRPSPSTYSFGGDLVQMGDDRTRPLTLPIVLPNNHFKVRESFGSIDFREIVAHKPTGP